MATEYITLAEYSQRIAKPLGSVYHDSRLNRIPGQTRFGRLVRIHWPTHQEVKAQTMVNCGGKSHG
jgi:hypothetical protein